MVLAVLTVICITRISLAPKYLYYFDSVNFALSLEEFNPAMHQPQPPGYPLFVAFLRLVHLFVPRAEHVQLAAGILTAALAVILVWWLGELMFSAPAGFSAAVLLTLNPAFWLAGISNQVRLWLAAGTAATAIACWQSMERPASRSPFLIAAAALGIAAGFRPAMLVLLLPLLIFSGIAAKRKLRDWIGATLILAAATGVWLGYTVVVSGGPAAYVGLLRDYATSQFSSSSALMGAPLSSAWTMWKAALVWNGLGVLSWVWAAALVSRGDWQPGLRLWFLAAWFVPPFVFHSLVHVGDPDHTLITVAVLCLAGGAVMARLHKRLTPEGWLIANGLALSINALLFFLPTGGLAGASTYRMVARIDSTTRSTFEAIGELGKQGPVTLVAYDSFVTWRHLSYYLRDTPLIVLREPHRGPVDPSRVWRIEQRRTMAPAIDAHGRIRLPAARRIIWLMPVQDAAAPAELARAVDLRQWGPVHYMEVPEEKVFGLGSYRFIVQPPAASGH